MEEVVAKRHNAAGVGYIIVIIIGLLVLILGCVVGVQAGEKGAVFIGIVIGALLILMGVYYSVRFFMIPNKAIVFKGGVLYLPRKVTCRPEELEKVFIKVYKSRYGVVSKYGKMEITVGGKVYKYNNISDVKRAQDRLLELNKQAIDALSRPAQEEKPAEDPFADLNKEN